MVIKFPDTYLTSCTNYVGVYRAQVSLRKFLMLLSYVFDSISKLLRNFLNLRPEYPSDESGDGPRGEGWDR